MKKLTLILVLTISLLSCGCSGVVDSSSGADNSSSEVSTQGTTAPDTESNPVSVDSDPVSAKVDSPVVSGTMPSARLYSFQKDNDVTYSIFWAYTVDSIDYLVCENWNLTPESGILDLSYFCIGKLDGSAINKAELTYLLDNSFLKSALGTMDLSVDNFSLYESSSVYMSNVALSHLGSISFDSYEALKSAVDEHVTPYTFMFGQPSYAAPVEELYSADPYAVTVNTYVENAGVYTTASGEQIPVTMLKAYFWFAGFMIQETWYINSSEGLVTASDALICADEFDISDLDTYSKGRFSTSDWVLNSDGGYYEPKAGQGTPIMEPDLFGASYDDCISRLCEKYPVSYLASVAEFSSAINPDGAFDGPSLADIYIRFAYKGEMIN